MKNDKMVYCEFGFIQELIRNYCRLTIDEWRSVTSIHHLLHLLYNSILCFDIPREKIVDEINKIDEVKANLRLFQIITRIFKNPRIKNSSEYPCINSSDICNKVDVLNSILLTLKNKKQRQELSSRLGIMVIGKEDILNFYELFKPNDLPIHKNESNIWEKINIERLKCSNAIIIEDNYVYY